MYQIVEFECGHDKLADVCGVEQSCFLSEWNKNEIINLLLTSTHASRTVNNVINEIKYLILINIDEFNDERKPVNHVIDETKDKILLNIHGVQDESKTYANVLTSQFAFLNNRNQVFQIDLNLYWFG